MSDYRSLLLAVEEGLATLSINRPDVLNALDQATVAEIDAAFGRVEKDPAVKAVVLTGAGDRSFVAGADIKEFTTFDAGRARDVSRAGQAILRRIEGLSKPVVAAVNGFALGGGCELAMACHVRVVGPLTKMGLPEVTLGLIPGYGGTQRLSRLVGRGKATELVLSGDMIDGREAYRIGLADLFVEPQLPADKKEAGAVHRQAVVGRASELARTMMKRGPVAIRYALEAIRRGADASLEEGEALEAALFGLCFATEDVKEGARAFLEKRPPVFKGV